MIFKLCGWTGCNKLCAKGSYYCTEHKAISDKRRQEHDNQIKRLAKSATRSANYSNPEWTKLKRIVLKDHPYCCYCGAKENLQVHHIRPVRFYPELFLEQSNLMVLCRQCHFQVTQREIKERQRRDR